MKLIVTTNGDAESFEFTTSDMTGIDSTYNDDGDYIVTYDVADMTNEQRQALEDRMNADDAVLRYRWQMDDDEDQN